MYRKVMKPRRKNLQKAKGEDLDPKSSSHHGISGLYEVALRRFKTIVYMATIIPLYLLGSAIMGLAFIPGIAVYEMASAQTVHSPLILRYFILGWAVAAGYFLYGFSLIFILPAANFLLRTSPRVFRGPYYSVDFLQWFIHNGLTYLIRYTFLEFVTPTPMNLLFYRLMGMKIGKGVQINSTWISDPALIELGDHVTIGGSAVLCAHYGQGGYLILAPVRIGNGVTVGLKASIMGGVEIGAGAKILPHSVVLPKTKIPAGETWGGVPAQKIALKKAA